MPDGRLLFGTINSFLVLDPQEIERKQSPVYPFYTGFTSANRSLSVDSLMQKEIIRLSPNENSIVIEFSDMSYRKDYKLWYKLEGLDKDWRRSDGLNQAIYSYLPSGDYMFTVRAEGEDGQIKESKPLKIKVNPPFYLSWWFYGVISLVIASLTYWYDREKQAKRKAVEKTRSQIADDLYHEINVTLNNIYMLSEMARIKADNNAPLSKEYIGQIHTKSKTMITAMDDILWSIKPENDDMEKFFRRMRELAEALSHEKDATISLSIADKAKMLQPDAKHKLLFYQVFKEAIQATLLAGGKQLTIEIDLVKGNLLFRLHDATATIDKSNEEIARLLKSLQERTAQLEGELDIESNHAGVSIAVAFPIS
jgi:signal transduction histidine kinase